MAQIMAQSCKSHAEHIGIVNAKNRLGKTEMICPALCQMCHTDRMLEAVMDSAWEHPLARCELADASQPLVLRCVYYCHAQRMKVDCPVDDICDSLSWSSARHTQAVGDGQRKEK